MNIKIPAFQASMSRFTRLALAAILLTTVLLGQGSTLPVQASTQTDIPGPAGSGTFGQQVWVLPNGNFVVTDPGYDAPGPIIDVGATYLYNGATGSLISTLTGSTAGDKVGYYGVTVLANGNYVVMSALWHNIDVVSAGAVTWGSSTTGVSGVVSAANSLVGSTTLDYVGGFKGVTALSNGNYVVCTLWWKDFAGAVTWGDGAKGVSGVVSADNSLVGLVSSTIPKSGDKVGLDGVTALSNGNYVVVSQVWNGPSADSVGAVTWGDGTKGVKGAVSAANSLVGSTGADQVGGYGVTALNNGNYVVASSDWQNGVVGMAGAVTWGDGTKGVKGAVSAANSLVGSAGADHVGRVTALSNGNYVVVSGSWNFLGAVTWGDGTKGILGSVSAANSLVGSTVGDLVGSDGVTALSNGNYVVASSNWQNGAAGKVGAVTWGNGATGVIGAVSADNSLVGSTAGDDVGKFGVRALSNGSYVVMNPHWHKNAAANVGAATWGNGAAGVKGAVSATNSLVGSAADDYAGSLVTALSNGNYVVMNPYWHQGTVANVGAATWGNGATGASGVISAANSLVGFAAGDYAGILVRALTNGNYVVASPYWGVAAGAVTWGNGATGVSGVISAANSLVGSTAGDYIGCADSACSYASLTALSNGNYVVASSNWQNGVVGKFVGAVTWGNGATGSKGPVSAANSLVGSTTGDYVGGGGVTALSNGNYVVRSPWWQKGTTAGAGAITPGAGAACATGLTAGPITAANSVLGAAANGGVALNFGYDLIHHQLVVGRPADNIVSLFAFSCSNSTHRIFLPNIHK